MIEAVFDYNQHSGNLIFRCKGHANAAPEGEDIICAAVTSHAREIEAAANVMYQDHWLDRPPVARVDKGNVKIRLHPKKPFLELIFYMLQMPMLGIENLEREYPEYVTLTKFGNA